MLIRRENRAGRSRQRGAFLIEALIGIIIFTIGALSLIALQTTAIAVQADAQYRIEAANLADRIIGDINLAVNRTSAATVAASLANFAHQPSGSNCNFSGAASTDPAVTAWTTAINTTARTLLPGSTAAMQQILVNTASFNQVTVTICWRAANDAVARRHTVVSYIN